MKKLFTLVTSLILALIVVPVATAEDKTSLHDFSITSIEMEEMDLSQFKGKTVLVVNTASECGFTPQYEGLQTLWSTYKDKGLVVLGIPANDFGGQEPGSAAEIKEFCEMNFQVSFPMGDKLKVIGQERHELYGFFASVLGEKSTPRWNFHKYLIDPEGKPIAYFSSRVTPMSLKLRKAIEASLPAS